MDKSIYKPSKIYTEAEEVNFTALLNSYCREFTNWSKYYGVPKYDDTLKEYIGSIEHLLYLKIDFSEIGYEVYVPLKYFSETGIHSFSFPVVERNLEKDVIKKIAYSRFLELTSWYAKSEFPAIDKTFTQQLMTNSIENLDTFLTSFQESGLMINSPYLSFIDAEQSLILGHSVHPLTKTREGFSDEDLLKYSPETKGRFQLYYFLIHPDNVDEKNAEGELPSQFLREEILAGDNDYAKKVIRENPEWKLVPSHPWEATYLLNQPEVREMKDMGLLITIGELGPDYTATSSVRTVYNEDSDWMYKFSLHVKITNSYRVNYAQELYRGYEGSCLLKTAWGEGIKKDFPEMNFITDPGYITVSHKGRFIDGFNTSIRKNDFKHTKAKKNVSLLAAICQNGILGNPSRIKTIIEKASVIQGTSLEETAKNWFKKYFDVGIRPLIGIFNKYGFGSEYHQQNVLLELGEDFFPSAIYFRDNQAFFIREEKKEELLKILPDFGKQGKPFIPQSRMRRYWDYYVISNNLFGVINALGKNGLADELDLIRITYDSFKAIENLDTTGYVNHFLTSQRLGIKGNLLTNLNKMDEATASRENPAIYRSYYNPLNTYFYSKTLLSPESKEVVYSRYFSKEDVTISIRPINLEEDLEMLHEWFHRDHAKKIWQMDWPIRELEAYYRNLIASNVIYSYIGEVDGVPTCNFEVYWPIRDIVGDYYDVLPTDYGTHQFIAPTDPKKKFVSLFTQCMIDYVFAQPEVGKMIGEGAVNSLASMMNKAHVGFKIEKVIEMPHKKANLNFCYREWYWAKFPQNKGIKISPVAERPTENLL
ncbi:GNAT family N-acetyltransferase [Aquimarina aquimarini]|uniref:GNAT family N-acetyltransferase n=1 Tax=Aquimarina aquimarini TaxID=1191734 RepID=UPI000D54CAA6|nr:GNAT family N-acetyltransferase [Aquimarina aquimarini]